MGDFGGFEGFGLKRIRDKFGEVYEVPGDLFDGGENRMARDYVARLRAERTAERQQSGVAPPERFSPFSAKAPAIPEPEVMSDFTANTLKAGMHFNENANPFMIAEPLGLADDWRKGRFVGQSLPEKIPEMARNLWAGHQQTFQQGMGELMAPFDPTDINDYGEKLLGGVRTLASVIPAVGPATSEAANMYKRGQFLEGTASAAGIGVGLGTPRLLSHLKDIKAARGIPTPDMAISDPSVMPIKYGPGESPVTYGPDSPVQGTYRPIGESLSTVPERFPRLMEQLMQDEHIVEPPPAGTWPERYDALGNAERAARKRKFAEHEQRVAGALQDPSTNATVMGALAPDSVTEPFTPYPQNQFGLLPEAIREPSADANFGVRPNPRHYGLRPSSEAEALGGMSDPNAPQTSIHLQNASPDNIARMEQQGYTVLEHQQDGTVTMRYDPEGKFAPPRKVELDLGGSGPEPKAVNPTADPIAEAKASGNPELAEAVKVIEKAGPTRKPGIIDRSETLSSFRNVYRHFIGEAEETTLGNMGEGGQALKMATQQATADSFAFSGKQTASFRRALDEATGKRGDRQKVLQEMVKHVENGTRSSNPAINKLVDAYTANDKVGQSLYTEAQLKMKNLKGETVPFKARENYWHHKFDDKTIQQNRAEILAEMMAPDEATGHKGMSLAEAEMALYKGKKQGYGFLDALHSRRGKIPGYRIDEDVAKGHWIDMARKAYNEKVLGGLKEDGSFVKTQLDKIGQEFGPEARVKAEQIMERYLDKDIPTFDATLMGKAASGMTRFQAITKLGLSTVGNMLGGTAMVGSRTRTTNMVRALADSFKASGRNAAEEMGSIGSLWRDSAMDQGYGSDVSKIYGIAGTEKHLRTFSALAGKHEANTLFKEIKSNPKGILTKNKIQQLQDLIIEPDMNKVLQQDMLSPNQIDRAGNRMTDLTQGRADSMNLPRAWSHPNPMVNTVTQFKKYAWIHSRNLKDAMKRNPLMIPRLAALMVASGEGVADFRALLSGKERPQDLPERVLDDLANSFGAGYFGDIVEAAGQDSWQGAAGKILPPMATDLLKWGVAGGKSIGSIGDDEPGMDLEPLYEEAAAVTPVVGGRWRQHIRENRE